METCASQRHIASDRRHFGSIGALQLFLLFFGHRLVVNQDIICQFGGGIVVKLPQHFTFETWQNKVCISRGYVTVYFYVDLGCIL